MATSETKENSLGEYEMLSEEFAAPPWAFALFNKMKSEICAEVTAKVAYSVRIMLDHFGEEMRTTLEAYHAKDVGEESQCSCKHPKKCQSCKEKRALLRASHHALKKEEKKVAKTAYKEGKKLRKKCRSSGSESEKEFTSQLGSSSKPLLKYDAVKAPPVPPRNISPVKVVGLTFAPLLEARTLLPEATVAEHTINIAVDSEPKIINGSSTQLVALLEAPATSDSNNMVVNAANNTSDQPIHNLSLSHAESYPSPSDSEFEVVSMPSNMNVAPELNRGNEGYPSISDYEDASSSSSSGDENETDTEIEFNSSKNLSVETGKDLQSKDSLYPELELKRMTLSMASSASTVIDDYMSTWSMEGAVGGLATTAEAPNHSGTVERQRAPYSVTPEEVEKINTQEIVHSQPLPSEFLRDRSPYSQIPPDQAANQQQQNGNILTAASQPQPRPQLKSSKQRTERDSRTYHVDNLPESLWDGALTVAAQTYNAAKAAVENLADTFVPVAPPSPNRIVITEPATAASKPQPRNVPSPLASINRPKNMTRLEERLFEMGFTNHVLNSTLLARHNQDIEKVIAELLDP